MEATITPEDQKRINSCDDYLSTKRIIKSCIDYKDHEVGTAVYIKENFPNSTRKSYVGAGYQDKEPPHKFIIIKNDEGFVFAKRIIASGNPGVEITCLTIRYPSDSYEIQVDSDYLDSMLLDTTYDPTSSAKDLARRKGKASRDNAKNRILFDKAEEAYSYLSNLKAGDVLWGAETSFGSEVTKYKVANVTHVPLDPKIGTYKSSWQTYESPSMHPSSIKEGLPDGLSVELHVDQDGTECRWSRGKTMWFYNITRKEQYKDYWYALYTRKPFKPEDIA